MSEDNPHSITRIPFWQLGLQAAVVGGTLLFAASAVKSEIGILQTRLEYMQITQNKMENTLDKLAEKINAVERQIK